MSTIWLIGWLFSLGWIASEAEEPDSWEQWIALISIVIWTAVLWPYVMGREIQERSKRS